MSMRHYDIAVVGSGGMGALFGSILFEKGLDVVLIDINHEHVKAIQTRGLQIEGFGGDRTLDGLVKSWHPHNGLKTNGIQDESA